jgi:hypothetical protein
MGSRKEREGRGKRKGWVSDRFVSQQIVTRKSTLGGEAHRPSSSSSKTPSAPSEL